MSLLPTETLDFGNGHAVYSDIGKRLANIIELERLDDCGNQFHVLLLHGFLSG